MEPSEALGWGVGKWKAGYKSRLPRLSSEEASLAVQAAQLFIKESQNKDIEDKEEAKSLALRCLEAVCEQESLELDNEQRKYLSYVVYLQTQGAGFLEELLSDPSLEEIAVNGLGKPVFVFVRGKGWKKSDLFIHSQDYFVSLANRLARKLGKRLTASSPRMNAILEDGSRMHASMPPISSCELTIRRFSSEPLTAFDLVRLGTFQPKAMSLVSLAMQCDLSVLFAGNTASGKTTTLNALLSCVPSSERILLIEETPEICIPHEHQLRLIPFQEGGIGMTELVRDSLRMRPDRVVVGEVRRPDEAQAFLECALSGQSKGNYATFHAKSAQEAMLRLRMMGCQEPDLPSISLIVVQRRVSLYDRAKRKTGEARKLTEIAVSDRSNPMKPFPIISGSSFSPSAQSRFEELLASSSNLSRKEISEEIRMRERLFASAKPLKYDQAFKRIQSLLFGGDLPGN
ncbi:MAG: ATPase, T2SS/T4P/T4SS family [Candidatus Micrarchaeota archaeon]|nr:ATPase, T2SS/T4P/T4SS family [Candidatus Micrarchaeota archaeon]